MSNRVYPRTVWVLQPSLKPVAVEVVKKAYENSMYDYGDETTAGKCYGLIDMYESKDAAIQAGRDACLKTQADIDKRTENLRKKIAVLDKAEGK